MGRARSRWQVVGILGFPLQQYIVFYPLYWASDIFNLFLRCRHYFLNTGKSLQTEPN
jgi:hypothetical protein